MADYYGSECTVVHVLRDQRSKDPDRIWIVTEDGRYSVADMDRRSSTLARGLSQLGVSAGASTVTDGRASIGRAISARYLKPPATATYSCARVLCYTDITLKALSKDTI